MATLQGLCRSLPLEPVNKEGFRYYTKFNTRFCEVLLVGDEKGWPIRTKGSPRVLNKSIWPFIYSRNMRLFSLQDLTGITIWMAMPLR